MEWLFETNDVMEEEDEEEALTIQPKDNLLNPEHLYTPEVYTKAPADFVAIKAKRLVRAYPREDGKKGNIKALNGLSLLKDSSVKPIHGGEFVMVMGPKGAGKSTFLRILATLEFVDSGELTVFSRNVATSFRNFPENVLYMRVNYIGYVSDNPPLLYHLSALENVEFPMGFYTRESHETRRGRAQELLKSFGIDASSETAVVELSKSAQQRIAIAQALANRPRLVLLDEPTKHLSHSETIDLMNCIHDYSRNAGHHVTTVMVTDNPLLCCYSNRMFVMKDGAIEKEKCNYVRRRLDKAKYVQHMAAREESASGEGL